MLNAYQVPLNTFPELITPTASKEWSKHKTFAAQALKNSGFGTRASEGKLLREINQLVAFIKEKKGAPFELENPLHCTATNVMLSLLLNTRYSWNSPEMKTFKHGCEQMYNNTLIAMNYDIFCQIVPFFILKWFMRSTLKEITKRPLTDYFLEVISAHRNTFDPNHMRDFFDHYIRDRTEENFNDSILIDMGTILFPDGIMTLSDVMLWAITYLQCYPDEQIKAQKQIEEVCRLSV